MTAVGHRIVHGGTLFTAPVRLDPAVLDRLEQLTPLAPLHQPHNLAPVRAIADLAPALPLVGCFDTAFHATQPHLAQAYSGCFQVNISGSRVTWSIRDTSHSGGLLGGVSPLEMQKAQ